MTLLFSVASFIGDFIGIYYGWGNIVILAIIVYSIPAAYCWYLYKILNHPYKPYKIFLQDLLEEENHSVYDS